MKLDIQGKAYSDQTGRFLVTSSRENKYVMILFDYDSNNVLIEYLRSRTVGDINAAYQKTHITLCNHGLTSKINLLDNDF